MVAWNDIEKLAARIGREFQPEQIVVFGSHAYGAFPLLWIDQENRMDFDRSRFSRKRTRSDGVDGGVWSLHAGRPTVSA